MKLNTPTCPVLSKKLPFLRDYRHGGKGRYLGLRCTMLLNLSKLGFYRGVLEIERNTIAPSKSPLNGSVFKMRNVLHQFISRVWC